MKPLFLRLPSSCKSVLPWYLLFGIWILWNLEPFYFIGMTTADQIGFSLHALADMPAKAWRDAELQGRVYFIFTKLVDFVMASRPESPLLHACNLALYATSPLWIAIAIFRNGWQRLLLIWLFLCLGWVGYQHMPPAAYPVVNHIAFPIWALLAMLARRWVGRSISPARLLAFSLLCLAALFQYEPITLMSVVILSWILVDTPLDKRNRQKLSLAAACALLAYAALYLAWACLHPSNYEGLQPGSLSPSRVLSALYAYTTGALPFLNGETHRLLLQWGDAIVGKTPLFHRFQPRAELSLLELAIAATGAAALFALAARRLAASPALESAKHGASAVRRQLIQYALPLFLLGLVLTIAPNALISFAAKYQDWARTNHEVYLTSQLSLYGLCAALVALATFVCHLVPPRRAQWALLPIVGLSALAAIPIHQSNKQLSRHQRSLLARWEALAVIESAQPRLQLATLVAPQFYFDTFTNVQAIGNYWSSYSKTRYKRSVVFQPDILADLGGGGTPVSYSSAWAKADV